jgi:PKD repeat protein
VGFTGSGSSDLDGTIDSYLWNFGDGSISELPDTEHIYNDVGEYTATLTVTDNMGAASTDSVNISVVGEFVCVSAHTVDLKTKGVFTSGVSTVTIAECNGGGAVVPQATVFGRWLAPASVIEDVSGDTEDNGQVIFESKTVRKAPPGTVFTFRVLNVEKTGYSFQSGPNDEASSPESAPSLVQTESSMGEPYPNPGNPGIWIPFTLSKADRVTIRIYDMSGRLLRTLELGEKTQGKYLSKDKAAYWDGKNEAGEEVASGIYFHTLQAGDFTATKKMIVRR